MQEEQKQPSQTEEPASMPTIESEPSKPAMTGESRWQRWRGWYLERKKWTIPASVVLLLLILAVIPWSRYQAAGLVVKKNFTIEVLDSTSRSPVSGATVSSGSVSSQTDGEGRATLRLSAGNHTVLISKKYYEQERAGVLVPILKQKNTPSIQVEATGRQVKVVVKNLISLKTLGDVDIKVADITAKTDKNGEAVVVLPAGQNEQKATLGLEGYDDSEVTVKISGSEILENNFNLTPSGKVYFISKRTGRLDLMKANLDGSDAKVVLAATGKERDYDTAILPSPDWKYVVLYARRSTTYATPQLHILSTEDDKLLNLDNANADFYVVGWSGDNLIYYSTRRGIPDWQAGNSKLKSYNASTGKITLLSQSSAVGDSAVSASEYYGFVTVSGESVIYAKDWSLYYDEELPEGLVEGKKHTLSVIGVNGQGNKQLASYDIDDYIEYSQHSPSAFYIWQQTGDGDKFFEYKVGSTAPVEAKIDGDEFYDFDKVFYRSPSSQKTLWAESRDGKFTLFLGDVSGMNSSVIESVKDYDAFGWFSDEYILITKDGSELHIMSVEGGKPVKITDFQPTS